MKFKNSNTSQIEGLHEIYNKYFNDITNGHFVEVGAYDGVRWSNTVSLINNGWGGMFIEPVYRFAQKCRETYKNNDKIKTYECCIGGQNKENQKVYFGGPCTTTLESMVEIFAITDPEDGHHLDRYTTTPMYTLDTFLTKSKAPENFEVLVIDVEGAEWNILEVFPIDKWKPKMAIIEVHETHPNKLKRESGNFEIINEYFINNGYKHIYGDDVNTIWVLS